MKNKILIAPQKYVQGPGVLSELGKFVKAYGNNAYVIADDFIMSLVGEKVSKGGKEVGVEITLEKFNGESSMQEINRHIEIMKNGSYDAIVGIGGGKTLDTAKAIAFYTKKPSIICPTLASTDAPTSALSIIYTPEGEFESYLHLPFNPNIVLVDTEMIVKAPIRTLIAGIGDAMATYYEAKVCVTHEATNMAGGLSTKAAFALATICRENLYKHAIKAVESNKAKELSYEFEVVVESNTLLSGLGFESAGLAAAHSVHDGLTELHETHGFLHGEKVSFGTVVQLVMEKDYDELEKYVEFAEKLGLPTTLKDLKIVEDIEAKVMRVAQKTVDPEETIHSYSYEITAQMVFDAI
ncbi:MAG: glycerol dehydrogenase, partial [Mycoplasmataceae bacterium]|nr:glycerol dehydrogenase [Mycoplasmataceae bacterium]